MSTRFKEIFFFGAVSGAQQNRRRFTPDTGRDDNDPPRRGCPHGSAVLPFRSAKRGGAARPCPAQPGLRAGSGSAPTERFPTEERGGALIRAALPGCTSRRGRRDFQPPSELIPSALITVRQPELRATSRPRGTQRCRRIRTQARPIGALRNDNKEKFAFQHEPRAPSPAERRGCTASPRLQPV